MKKLGFLIDNLGYSQDAFFLINWTNIATATELAEVSVFHNGLISSCLPCGFGTLNIQEAFSYDGPLIANNLRMATRALNCIGAKKLYLYVWDLEWLRLAPQYKNYHALAAIYRNPKLRLICRSDEHKRVMEDHWNVEVTGVVDNYNINELLRVIYD